MFEEKRGYLKKMEGIWRKWRVFEENGGLFEENEGYLKKREGIWREEGVFEENGAYLK